ncbi:single-stranded DNA-binding protein [Nonomuraea soli]|uniref:Single-strand DNA-binding protein n=1 Tax=Nonomuraea soli TaxID=1032476 RepID=A0A7W0HU90_9ACTN|nr:single-stranded DNA-binding protein [Nonomuraea soli]MBA2895914.1 single-strand DNA-binding protein [Nonomuraea soli]
MDRNEVVLVGRLSAVPEQRSMPSGDTLTTWKVIVKRRPGPGRSRRPCDIVPCVTFDPEVADALAAIEARTMIEMTGSLRSRIFGPNGAKVWRYEVEAKTVAPVEPSLSEPSPEPTEPAEPSAPRSVSDLAGVA